MQHGQPPSRDHLSSMYNQGNSKTARTLHLVRFRYRVASSLSQSQTWRRQHRRHVVGLYQSPRESEILRHWRRRLPTNFRSREKHHSCCSVHQRTCRSGLRQWDFQNPHWVQLKNGQLHAVQRSDQGLGIHVPVWALNWLPGMLTKRVSPKCTCLSSALRLYWEDKNRPKIESSPNNGAKRDAGREGHLRGWVWAKAENDVWLAVRLRYDHARRAYGDDR